MEPRTAASRNDPSEPSAPINGRRQLTVRWLILAVGYALLGLLASEQLPHSELNLPFWPAAGLAVGLVIASGPKLLSAVTVGSFAINLHLSSGQVGLALVVALGSTLQTGVAAAFARHLEGRRPALCHARSILAFLLGSGLLSSLIGSSIGSLAQWHWGVLSTGQLPQALFTWWAGDSLGVLVVTPAVLMLLPEMRPLWEGRRRAILLPSLLLLLLTLLAYVQAVRADQNRVREDFRSQARSASFLLSNNISRHSEAIDSVRRLVLTNPAVKPAEFEQFSAELVERLPGLQALSWNPLVAAADRAGFEQQQRESDLHLRDFAIRERDAEGRLVPAGTRQRYLPVALIEPLAANQAAVGFDLLSNPTRAEAAERAERTGRLQATDPITLVQENGRQKGVLLLQPVKPREGATRGYAVGVYRLDDLLRSSFQHPRDAEWRGIRLELLQTLTNGQEELLASSAAAPADRSALAWAQQDTIHIGGQRWTLRLLPSAAAVQSRQSNVPRQLLLAGVVVLLSNEAMLLLVTGQHQSSRRQAAISHYEATHDPLTDLLNRRPFLAELDKARQEADSDLAEHVLVAIDLDHFKPVNDQAGHAAGDRLLKDIAQLMRRQLREGDILARLGGDEFAVILRLCPLSTGVRIARGLLKSIERYQLTWQHQHFRVTASLGVVGLNAGNRSLPSSEALMQQVDRALYNAKQEGRNTVMVVQSDGTVL